MKELKIQKVHNFNVIVNQLRVLIYLILYMISFSNTLKTIVKGIDKKVLNFG